MVIWLWVGFILFVCAMLAVDIGAFHRKAHAVGVREACIWTCVWIALALIFNVFVYYLYTYRWFGSTSELSGTAAAAQFLTAYLVEKSLSLDNIFVFALIFAYFRVPAQFQHRVLFWGVVGALILRGVMIGIGAALISRFAFMHYVFAGMLLYAAVKMLRFDDSRFDPQGNIIFRLVRRLFPVSNEIQSQAFTTRLPDGRFALTPLFLVLVVIESTDVLFAVDSIPAVFGITKDPFIVFTSNIFAILGLRALYFVLSSLLSKFEKLKLSLVVVLMYIACKMLLESVVEIPTGVSLLIVLCLIAYGILWSVLVRRRKEADSQTGTMN